MKEWKVGVVGTGYWSDNHLKAWERIPNVKIQALCNRSSEKLQMKAKQYNVPLTNLYNRLEDMLDKEDDLDIVDIVTGPETHLDFVRLAATAGKHIMCQKPFASSMDEAESIVQIAEKAGIKLMVTENWRWTRPYQVIKKVLDEKLLGELYIARYSHTGFFTPRMSPDKQLPQPFFRSMPKLLFYEMGAHWFDVWRFLFGEPQRVYANTKGASPYITGEDTGTVVLSHDNFYGFMDMSWATRVELKAALSDGNKIVPHNRDQMIIEGTQATLKLSYNGDIVLIDNNGLESKLDSCPVPDSVESHFRLHSHFIDCLDNDKEPVTSGRDNLLTLRLIFATYDSAEQKKLVNL